MPYLSDGSYTSAQPGSVAYNAMNPPSGGVPSTYTPGGNGMIETGGRGGQTLIEPAVKYAGGAGASRRLPGLGGQQKPNSTFAPQDLASFVDYVEGNAPATGKKLSELTPQDLSGMADTYARNMYVPHLENAGFKVDNRQENFLAEQAKLEASRNYKALQDYWTNKEKQGQINTNKGPQGPSVGETAQGVGQRFAGGVDTALSNIIKGGSDKLDQLADWIDDKLGTTKTPGAFSKATAGTAQYLKEGGQQNLPGGANFNPLVAKQMEDSYIAGGLGKGAEILGGSLPYVGAAALGGVPAAAVVGGAGGAGSAINEQEDRVNAMPDAQLKQVPAYQTALKQTGDPAKARALVAKAAGEAASNMGAAFGAVMNSIGGGALTKPVQAMIAKAVGQSAIKKILASAAGEGAGFAGLGAAQNVATTEAANKATGEDRYADIWNGVGQNLGLGVLFGTLGSILHAPTNPLVNKGAEKAAESTVSPVAPTPAGEKPAAAAPAPETPANVPQTAQGGQSSTLTPAQQQAYNQVAQQVMKIPETVPAGEQLNNPAHVLAKLDEAKSQFKTALESEDIELTPQQMQEAENSFVKDWAANHGVDQKVLAPQEVAPQAQEAAPAAQEAAGQPTPAQAEQAVQQAAAPPTIQEKMIETPEAKAAAQAAAEMPGAFSDNRHLFGEFEHPPLEPRDLVTQHGADSRLPFSLTEKVAADLREKNGGKEPTIDDINHEAKAQITLLNSQKGINELLPPQARIEAIGDLLAKDPKEMPTAADINATAKKLIDSHTLQDRLAERRQEIFDRQKSRGALPEVPKAEEKPSEKVPAAANPLAKPRVKVPVEAVASPKAEAAAQEGVAAKRTIDENGRPVTGRTVDDVRAALSKELGESKLKDLEKNGVLKFVQSQKDLPGNFGDSHYTYSGLYDGKSGYLVADHIAPGHELPTLVHEVGVHYGLRRMLPSDLYSEIESYIDKNKATDEEIKSAYSDAQAAGTDPRIQLNETIATMVSNRGAEKGSIWSRALASLKSFLYDKIGKYLPQSLRSKLINNDSIMALAKSATRSFEKRQELLNVPAFSRKPQPATAEEIIKASQYRPPVEKVNKQEQSLKNEPTRVQKFTQKWADVFKPFEHYNELMERAKTPVKEDANMYQALSLLVGRRHHEEDHAYSSLVVPFQDALKSAAEKMNVDQATAMSRLQAWARAKSAIELNRRGELQNIKLSTEAEAQRAGLLPALHNGELNPDHYMDRLGEIVNAPGARQENKVAAPFSGIANEEAVKVLKQVKKEGLTDEIAEQLNKYLAPIREQTIANNLAAGKFSKRQVDILKAYKSKYYFPQTGWTEGADEMGMGRSAAPLSAFNKEAVSQGGRKTLADDPVMNLLSQFVNSARDIANNEAMGSLFRAAKDPNSRLDATVRSYDVDKLVSNALKETGRLADMQQVYKSPNTVLFNQVLKDGRVLRHSIELPENSPQLQALKEWATPKEIGDVSKFVGKLTNFYGRVHTTLSPVFAAMQSLFRDTTYAPMVMAAEGKAKFVPGYAKNWMAFGGPAGAWKTYFTMDGMMPHASSFADIEQKALKDPNSYAGWLYRLSKVGGAISFRDEFNNARDANKLLKEMGKYSVKGLNPLQAGAKVTGIVWDYLAKLQDAAANASMMTARVALFKTMVEHGVGEKEAGMYARKLLDFQQKAANSESLNRYFAFSRVGFVSADRIAKVFKTAEGKFDAARAAKVVPMFTALFALTYEGLKQEFGDDIKKFTNDTLAKNFIVPNPADPQHPFQIPLGLGLPRLLWGIGSLATRLYQGHTTPKEAFKTLFDLTMENVSPLHPIEAKEGVSAGTIALDTLAAVVPSITRPPVELGLNQNPFGGMIYNDHPKGYASDSGFRTTAPIWKDLATHLREWTGADLHPESLSYLVNAYGPGMVSELFRSFKKDQMEKLGIQTDWGQSAFAPHILSHDLDYGDAHQLSLIKGQLEDAKNQENNLKQNKQQIPYQLQNKIKELNKIDEAMRKYSQKKNAIEDNNLTTPQAKASQLASLNAQWNVQAKQLTSEAQNYLR